MVKQRRQRRSSIFRDALQQILPADAKCDNQSLPSYEIGPDSALTVASKADPILCSSRGCMAWRFILAFSTTVESIE